VQNDAAPTGKPDGGDVGQDRSRVRRASRRVIGRMT
jgi:hypothetical protein